jgi:O-antigen/teichoic acid export membrane protein
MGQTLVGAGLLFVLYRYINDTLGAAGLGVWSVVMATASASRLTDLGLSASVTRFVARYLARGERKTAAQVVETAAVSLMAILALALPLLQQPLAWVLRHLFDGMRLAQALALLPYALASLWLTVVGAVFQSGLDGCQRMDLRAGLVVAGQVVLVGMTLWLVPQQGLLGLALAQIAQGVFLVATGWWLLRARLPQLSRLPLRWSRPVFGEMLGYGANVQIAALFMLLFDPLTKVLMARFGGPEAAGYFEMANQVVLKVRSLIVAANQAVVPKVAQIAETFPERLALFYRDNVHALIFVALPTFTLLYAWGDLTSLLLVGAISTQLLLFLRWSVVGWALNVFCGPAYFYNLGTGRVGLNTVSHLVMGALNGVMGWSLGRRFGPEGVIVAYVTALVTGSWLLVIATQLRSALSMRDLALGAQTRLAMVCLAVVVGAHLVPAMVRHPGTATALVAVGAPLAVALAVWSDPLRKGLWRRFLPRFLEPTA